MNIFKKQAEFLTAGDVEFPSKDAVLDDLVFMLIYEEFDELMAEDWYTETGNINELKECIDLMYACAQKMNHAVGPEKATQLFEVVHANNMSKCIEGKLVKRDDGKILKPEGFDKDGWRSEFERILCDE